MPGVTTLRNRCRPSHQKRQVLKGIKAIDELITRSKVMYELRNIVDGLFSFFTNVCVGTIHEGFKNDFCAVSPRAHQTAHTMQ